MNGIWHKVGLGSLLFIVVVSLVLLAIVIAVNVFVARRCGALTKPMRLPSSSAVRKEPGQRHSDGQYSLPTSILGIMVLPLMIFHQIQLMVCAVLARRYKQQTDARLAEEKANAAKALTRFLQGLDQIAQPPQF